MVANNKTLSYQFADLVALKKAFMPFVRDGGIFIPTTEKFHLGELVQLTIQLPNHEKPFAFTGEIIWITPPSAQSENRAGVGIQCSGHEGETFQKKARELLAELKEESAYSDTL